MQRENGPEVASFYHLPGGLPPRAACRGLACFVARHDEPERWRQACAQHPPVHCLGRCYAGPALASDVSEPSVEIHATEGIVLGDALVMDPTLDGYRQRGGYGVLERATASQPSALVAEISRSALRGRGGAGFPAGHKWQAVAAAPGRDKVVVANGDEGDPGAYVDRVLMERSPHRIIEALLLAAYAIGAARGYIYVRCEYPAAAAALRRAAAEARAGGGLAAFNRRGAPPFQLEIVEGRGSYVCGEETALLNAIEGRRPGVRARPPYPTMSGLFGLPTLVHNIETLASVPWIIAQGGDAYRAIGYSTSRGTKVVCLNSLFRRPGLYEVDLGLPVRRIIDELGGGVRTGAIKGAICGGPLAGIIPPTLFETPFAFDELRAIGAAVGHGGVVALDERTSIRDLMHEVFRFGAFESCGVCPPCRLGATRVETLFRNGRRRGLFRQEHAELSLLVQALAQASLCGHGTGLAEFSSSVLKHYAEELEHAAHHH